MSFVKGIFSLSVQEVYDNLDTKAAIEKGFNGNVQVYTIVRKAAHKFGSIPRYVYSNEKKEIKSKRHVLQEIKAYDRLSSTRKGIGPTIEQLIARPNPYMSQDLFYAMVYAYYKVCGNAYIWCNRGDITDYTLSDGTMDDAAIDKLPILEMYVLPAHMVTIVGEEDNPFGISGYILETTNRPFMRKNDVIHWRDINLNWSDDSRSHLQGMTPLGPGSKTLEESNSLSKAAMRMAQNEGSKAVIFDKSMKAMSPAQQTDLKKVIDAKVNNNEVAGSVAAIQGDWGMLDLAMSSRDMEMIEKKKMSWHEIALLLDMPPELVVTDAKYDNAGNAMLQWVYNLIPALKQLDEEMNMILMPAFGLKDKAFIASDVTELPEVRKQMMEEAKVMQEIWSIPPNDILDHLGFERNPDKRFDEPWVVSGRTPLSESSVIEDMQATIDQINMSNANGGGNQ